MTTGACDATARPFLIDVSRLIWRFWSGRLPTGIDRVCLAYHDHFGSRAQAVVQRDGHFLILSPRHSDLLFGLLRQGPANFRHRLVLLAAAALPSARRRPPRPGMVYLNVGHTGLHEPSLPAWVHANRVRAVYLIHDLIPITHPEYCRAGEAAKHAVRMRNALDSAAGIIGNSQATLDQLAAFAREQGRPMPPSVAALLGGAVTLPETVIHAFDPQPYFVVLGTIEGRKNHALLLRIWQQLVAAMGTAAPTLLVIGQRGWEAEATLELLDRLADPAGKVRELGRCSDVELAGWIAGARALLMPSFAEGYGLPVIEALALGTPVIASDLPVFREIAGDIPLYIDSNDEPRWEEAIKAYAPNGADRARQLAAISGLRVPDWEAHFAIVDAWLESLEDTHRLARDPVPMLDSKA